jgi:prepilin-type N-terminal cleavage/methylation domain-containing protein
MAKPSRDLFSKSNKGFTLVETMVSVGIMSVILAGLATAVVTTVRDGEVQAKESMTSMEDLMVQTAQQDYLTRAAPSYYFLHIPIRSFCSGSEKIPCLRQIDPATGGLVQVNSTAGIPATIGYYKDVSGELKNTKLSGMSASGDINNEVHMISNDTLDVSKLTSQKNNSYVYASWPLYDEYSEALPILVRKKGAAILTHIKQYGASYENEAPTGISLFQVALTTDKAQILANDLKDSLAVIYNINRPSQFVIQKITNTTNCPLDASTRGFCKTTGNSISPLATTQLDSDGFNNVMALKIDNLQISGEYDDNGQVGSRAHLSSKLIPTSKSVSVQGSWFAGNGSNDFLFPRSSFSLFDDRPGYQGDLSYSPVDVKRIQHYLNANNSDTSLVVLPVDLGYIKLKQSAQYADKFDLVVTSASHLEIILVPSIKLKSDTDSYVYVNRRLGTGIIEIFIK